MSHECSPFARRRHDMIAWRLRRLLLPAYPTYPARDMRCGYRTRHTVSSFYKMKSSALAEFGRIQRHSFNLFSRFRRICMNAG
jgi:hypothetical protein